MATIPKIFNRARMSTATTGTGTVTLGSAATGYFSFSEAGVSNGDVVEYLIEDGNDFELGIGTYTSSGTTLSRDTVVASKISTTAGTTKLTLSGTATVSIVALATEWKPNFQPAGSNLSISCSVASNALTIAVKNAAGADASEDSPIRLPFRSSTLTSGALVPKAITAALSLTVSSGSTLGITNGVAARIHLVVFDDAGTMRLGVMQRITGGQTPTAIAPLPRFGVASSTAEGGAGAADSAGVFYTGTAVTSKAYTYIGYIEYTAITTAGTYAATPDVIQPWYPGIPLPGDLIQSVQMSTSSVSSTTSTSYQSTTTTANITPTSAPNPIRHSWAGTAYNRATSNTVQIYLAMHRGSTLIGAVIEIWGQSQQGNAACAQNPMYDVPNATSSTTYVVKIKGTDGSTNMSFPADGSCTNTLSLDEVWA